MKYTQRLHQFTKTRTWEANETELSWSDEDGRSGVIPYSEIQSVRLRFEPSRAEKNRYAMRIYTPQEWVITNINFRGIMDFEDQSDDYAAFVEDFHRQLAPVNPKTRFLAGSTMGAWIGNFVISVFVLIVLLGIALLALMGGLIWLVAVKAAILIFYIPVMVRLILKNKPASYEPMRLPAQHRPG